LHPIALQSELDPSFLDDSYALLFTKEQTTELPNAPVTSATKNSSLTRSITRKAFALNDNLREKKSDGLGLPDKLSLQSHEERATCGSIKLSEDVPLPNFLAIVFSELILFSRAMEPGLFFMFFDDY
jgi:hypothetical protein